jgi:hypothetical protein
LGLRTAEIPAAAVVRPQQHSLSHPEPRPTPGHDPAPTCSLQTAKKADPSYLERFAIFSREQQHTQKSAGNSGQATDLVSYVEFQRNYRLVMKVHKEALLSMRAFWMCLLQVTA